MPYLATINRSPRSQVQSCLMTIESVKFGKLGGFSDIKGNFRLLESKRSSQFLNLHKDRRYLLE